MGVDLKKHAGRGLNVYSPIDGSKLASLKTDSVAEVNDKIKKSVAAFKVWREVPAPKRGELIRLFGVELRRYKDALGKLVTIECGKILAEGCGEVQEMIDICDFATGISRQLHGLTIASERPQHAMQETWHPLGPVFVISAFNFPVAVWAWNFALGHHLRSDPVIWKPSEKTPLCAIACQSDIHCKALNPFCGRPAIMARAALAQPDSSIGDAKIGEKLAYERSSHRFCQRHRQHPHGPRGGAEGGRTRFGQIPCSSSAAITRGSLAMPMPI